MSEISANQNTKREWKKEEKSLYLPKTEPVVVEVPEMAFFVLEGQGNPNSLYFADCIEALYGAAYAVRMSHKGKEVPEGYYEYTVYPLEGVWDLTEAGRAKQAEVAIKEGQSGAAGIEGQSGAKDVSALKDEFVFQLMIRQPDFLTETLATQLLEDAYKKKKNPLTLQIRFEKIREGKCIQMLHEGSYDTEPASFQKMEAFAAAQGLKRKFMTHREIYLSDARKTKPEALKTVLRFQAE